MSGQLKEDELGEARCSIEMESGGKGGGSMLMGVEARNLMVHMKVGNEARTR